MKKTCDVCNAEFETRTRSPNRERFCCKRCARTFWNRAAWRAHHPERDLRRSCVVCGGEFCPPPTHPYAVTCSTKCSQKRFADAKIVERAICRDMAPRACAECGSEFVPSKYSWHRHRFCSSKCSVKANRRIFAERHPERVIENGKQSNKRRWGGNHAAALDRDGHKCVQCGSEKKLRVHHRDGSGEAESPNHDLSNLETLCATCHKRIHKLSYLVVGGVVVISGPVFEHLSVTKVRIA